MNAAIACGQGNRGANHVDRRTHIGLDLGQLHACHGRALHPHCRLLNAIRDAGATAASREARDGVLKSGMESGVSRSYDRLAEQLGERLAKQE